MEEASWRDCLEQKSGIDFACRKRAGFGSGGLAGTDQGFMDHADVGEGNTVPFPKMAAGL